MYPGRSTIFAFSLYGSAKRYAVVYHVHQTGIIIHENNVIGSLGNGGRLRYVEETSYCTAGTDYDVHGHC